MKSMSASREDEQHRMEEGLAECWAAGDRRVQARSA